MTTINATPILNRVNHCISDLHKSCIIHLIGLANVNLIAYYVISRYIEEHEHPINDYTNDDIDTIVYHLCNEWRIHAIRCFSNKHVMN